MDRLGALLKVRAATIASMVRPIQLLASMSALVVLFFAAFTFNCKAQVTPPPIPDNNPSPASPLGIEPGASAAGTNEAVNFGNGSVNLFIPLISFPQRGGYSMGLGYVHHSNAFAFQQDVQVSTTSDGSGTSQIFYDVIAYQDSFGHYDPLLNINLPRLQFSYEYVGSATAYAAGKQDHRVAFFCAANFVFTDWGGNKHPFENNTMCNTDHIQGSAPATNPALTLNITDSSDGSFYQLDTTNANDMTVVANNGTVYHFTGYANLFPPPNQPGPPGGYSQENAWDSRASSIVDTNGNTIHISTALVSNSLVYTITDTIGRTVVVNSAGVSYNDSNGTPQQIELQTSSATNTTQVQVPLSCYYHGPSNGPGPLPTVQAVGTAPYQAPQYTQETITFPSPAGGSGQRVYTLIFDPLQKITKVQYPAGGYTRYDYAGGQLLPQQTYVTCSGGPPAQIAHKYECRNASGSCAAEDTTKYQPVINTNAPTSYNQQMTVTDPLGQKEVHLFSTTTAIRTNPQETDIDTYNAGGTLIKAVHKAYPPINPPGTNQYSYDITFPSSITTSLSDVSPAVYSVTSIVNAPYTVSLGYAASAVIDNPTDIKVSDYSTSTSGGTILKHISQQWEPASAFTPTHILDRLQWSTTTDPATGLSGTTTNGYDTAGNITSVTKNGTNTGSYTTQYPRNSYGQIKEIIDPTNNTTTIGYDDEWSDGGGCVRSDQSAYPTSITNALNQTTHYSYSSCTGTISSITDPNGVVTGYSYEAQDRVISKTVKDSSNVLASSVSVAYADAAPAKITTNVAQDSTHSISTETDLDGLGRELRSTLLNDPQGPACTDTFYDALGRKSFVTNRHRGYSSPTDGVTGFTYDALNRPLLQCNQDDGITASVVACSSAAPPTITGSCATAGSSYRQWSYANQTTDIYDEHRNHSQQTVDGLDELTMVKEPNSSNTPALETDYTYALGNLTNVNQKGTGGDVPRLRTFTYDGLSRLITATNPETGQICYGTVSGSTCTPGYDQNGNLLTKTDARGAVTHFAYDALNRVTSKTYTIPTTRNNIAPTSNVSYTYDVAAAGWGWPAQTTPSYPSTSQTNLVGRLTAASVGSLGANAWTVYGYDALGRVNLKSECLPIDCGNNHHDMRYRYDLAGELTFYDRGLDSDRNSGLPNSGFYFGGFTLSYDRAGNLSGVVGDTAGTNRATNILSNTVYFPDGQQYTAQLLGVFNDKYSVNSRQWYTGEVITDTASNTLWQSSAARNNTGTVSATTDTAAGNWSYTYDNLNRLLTSAGPNGSTSYGIDDFGNKTQQTVTSGSAWPQLNHVNSNNAFTDSGLGYELANSAGGYGNLTYDGFHNYTYDAEGRLYRVDNNYCYTYDGNGDRVAKTNCNVVNHGDGTTTGILAEYLYDTNHRLMAEINVSTEQIARANIYAGDRFIAEDAPDSFVTTTTATQLRVVDQVGSLRGMLDLGKHVVGSFTSYPYGEGYTCSSSSENMFFTGTRCDAESQLDYFGARYYTDTLGRFMSPDWSATPEPVPYAKLTNPQSLNLYAYGQNNPVGAVDADGHAILGDAGPPACPAAGSIGCSPEQKEQFAQHQNGDPTLPTVVQEPALNSLISWFDQALNPSPEMASQLAFMVATDGLGDLAEAGAGVTTKIVSSIGKDTKLIKFAEEAGKSVQKGLDSLTDALSKGNTNPGIGTKGLGKGISYARARGGARVFFRQSGNQIEILAKASKANEPAVINYLNSLF